MRYKRRLLFVGRKIALVSRLIDVEYGTSTDRVHVLIMDYRKSHIVGISTRWAIQLRVRGRVQ